MQDLAASVENGVGPACAWALGPEAPGGKGAVSPSSSCPGLEAEGSEEVTGHRLLRLGAVPTQAPIVKSGSEV